jgi:hypothetical protein
MLVGYLVHALDDTVLTLLKGTSDHPLPDVKMDCVYAGSDAGSLASEFRKRYLLYLFFQKVFDFYI